MPAKRINLEKDRIPHNFKPVLKVLTYGKQVYLAVDNLTPHVASRTAQQGTR